MPRSRRCATRRRTSISDLLLHDMGVGLADDISQGAATGREFRTAPLWGLGQRVFFLHDGRSDDLKDAVREHSSTGSEANQVVIEVQRPQRGEAGPAQLPAFAVASSSAPISATERTPQSCIARSSSDEDLERAARSRFAARHRAEERSAAGEHRLRAERARLDDVDASAYPAVEQHGQLSPDRPRNIRQGVQRRASRRRAGGRRGWRPRRRRNRPRPRARRHRALDPFQ